MRAERHDVVTFQWLLLQRKTPSTMEAVYRPLCHASASSVAARPVPRQSERCVKSRPLRQLHRWHSGIIGHGRTDWMKSDNCRVHPALTRNTLEEGVEKGGAAGSGIGNRGPPVSGANSCNENPIRPTATPFWPRQRRQTPAGVARLPGCHIGDVRQAHRQHEPPTVGGTGCRPASTTSTSAPTSGSGRATTCLLDALWRLH